MQMFVRTLLLTALLFAGLPVLAQAGAGVPSAKGTDNNPMILTARDLAPAECVRHVRTGTGEILVNQCSACMVVNVTRNRTGIPQPEVRTFNVQANSTFPLPFKGPGRTTLGSVRACEAANLMKPETLGQAEVKCVTLETDRGTGGVYLVNSCRTCRAAAVARMTADGQLLGRSSYVLGGKGNLRLAPEGAAKVGLTGEDDCPRVIQRSAN